MIFSSLQFLVFFVLVFGLYLLVKNKGRIHFLFLLAVSYVFYYSWSGIFLSVLVAVTLADYLLALQIEKQPANKKLFLGLGIAFNLLLLGFFKYSGFLVSNINNILGHFGPHQSQISFWDFALPVGISFFTFKSMGYIIDVYHGRMEAEKDLLKYAVFVAFFPDIMAGPIVRAQTLIPQLNRPVLIGKGNLVPGLKQFLIGFYKKLFIADMIAPYSDNVFGHIQFVTPYETWVGIVAYSIQIYCDFSGYTDMAIGLARMLGYEFPENFNRPFAAQNIASFWRRWNISVTLWFTDYLFLPLSVYLRHWGRIGLGIAVMATFVLCGIWHGAGWNFAMFGALHGAAFILYYQWLYLKKKLGLKWLDKTWLWNAFSVATTLFFVMFAWVFFRAPSWAVAQAMLVKMGSFRLHDMYFMPQFYYLLSLVVLGTVCYPYFYREDGSFRRHQLVEKAIFAYMVIGILVLAPVQTSPFIYFRF